MPPHRLERNPETLYAEFTEEVDDDAAAAEPTAQGTSMVDGNASSTPSREAGA